MQISIAMGLVVFCAILGGIAQIVFKHAIEPINLIKLGIGLGLYGVAMLLYLWALRSLPLNVAYPIIACSYIIVIVLSTVILGEAWSIWKLVGSVGIVFSVWLVTL